MIELGRDNKKGLAWVQQAYDSEFDYGIVQQLDSLYHWFFKLLKLAPSSTLLDVACGNSQLVELATQRGVQAIGLDFAHAPIRELSQTRLGQYLTADAETMPFPDDYFDYVTSIGSLEHYPHMAQGVQELARVLNPAGQAIIFVPNTFSLLHNVYTACKTGLPLDDGQPFQRFATRVQWESLITQNGLTIQSTHKYEREFPTSWSDAFWYLTHPRKLVYLSLTPFIPLNLSMCFAFICQKGTAP